MLQLADLQRVAQMLKKSDKTTSRAFVYNDQEDLVLQPPVQPPACNSQSRECLNSAALAGALASALAGASGVALGADSLSLWQQTAQTTMLSIWHATLAPYFSFNNDLRLEAQQVILLLLERDELSVVNWPHVQDTKHNPNSTTRLELAQVSPQQHQPPLSYDTSSDLQV